jgi:hypothetical protein
MRPWSLMMLGVEQAGKMQALHPQSRILRALAEEALAEDALAGEATVEEGTVEEAAGNLDDGVAKAHRSG